MNRLDPDEPLRAGLHHSGTVTWRRRVDFGEVISSIGYSLNTVDPSNSWVDLSYTISGTGEQIECRNELVTGTLCSGGIQWFFVCPLIVNGNRCRARARKLYLPPGARYFGCRRCYDLTYTSVQTHDKRFDHIQRQLRMAFR